MQAVSPRERETAAQTQGKGGKEEAQSAAAVAGAIFTFSQIHPIGSKIRPYGTISAIKRESATSHRRPGLAKSISD